MPPPRRSLALAQDAAYEIFAIETRGSWAASSSSSATSRPPVNISASCLSGSWPAASTTRRLPIWADTIETLVRLGELEPAGSLLESYEVHAQRLGSPYARAGAARCRGLLLAAERDLPVRCRRSSGRWPTRSGFRSSVAGHCCAWGWCVGRRSRRGRRVRHWRGRLRSSRSWARGCGRRRPARSCGG